MSKIRASSRITLLAGAALLGGSLLPIMSSAPIHGMPGQLALDPGSLNVWILDVGQGSCAYVECPEGKEALILDCGTASMGKSSPLAISSWINSRALQMKRVTAVVSHGDRDHYSIFPAGVNRSLISDIWLGGEKADYGLSFLRWANSGPKPPSIFKPGEAVENDRRFSCGAAKVDLLSSNAHSSSLPIRVGSRKNADSLVLRLSYGANSIILAGDAEGITQEAAIKNAGRMGIDLSHTTVLVASHHGAATFGSNSANWLSSTHPSAAVFSAQTDFHHRHPRCDVVKRFAAEVNSVAYGVDLACGQSGNLSSFTTPSRLLSSFQNGHMLLKLGPDFVQYSCQRKSPACDQALN